MAFDWLEFLRAKRIHYATKGRNVAAGAVAIKCPFCGAADPSEHLVIRLNGRGWWCWRNRAHRGHSAAWLVSRLLHVSVEAAAAITKETQFLPSGDFLTNMRRTLFGEITLEGEADAGPDPLDKPREWRSIVDGTAGRAYRNYLRGRGFTDLMIARMRSFDISYCLRGSYARRILFPVYFMGELVGWTGRAIDSGAFLRYKTLSHEPEKAEKEGFKPAPRKLNDYLLWYDMLMEETDDRDDLTLLICEGPMDGLNMNLLGINHGIMATCVFTSSPTATQMDLLYTLIPRFKAAYWFLDRGMEHQARQLQSDTIALGTRVLLPPSGRKDPGEIKSIFELPPDVLGR